jgi:hypothetical protein
MILHVLDGSSPPATVEVQGIRPGAGTAAVTAVARGRGMRGYAIDHWHWGMSWVPEPTPKPAQEGGEGSDGEDWREVGGEG